MYQGGPVTLTSGFTFMFFLAGVRLAKATYGLYVYLFSVFLVSFFLEYCSTPE